MTVQHWQDQLPWAESQEILAVEIQALQNSLFHVFHSDCGDALFSLFNTDFQSAAGTVGSPVKNAIPVATGKPLAG